MGAMLRYVRSLKLRIRNCVRACLKEGFNDLYNWRIDDFIGRGFLGFGCDLLPSF